MATAYTSLLGLALPVTGELSGTWGSTVNTEITALLDSAIAGTTTLSTDADVTLTTTTGAANTSRQAILLCSGARTVLRTITAPAQSKIYTIINATTGGFSVKLVGAGPTTGVTIVAGESAVCAWNGSDFIKISNTAGAASFTNLTVTGTLGVTGVATLGNGAVLGTPASGTVTNLTGTASININGTVGATTATTGAFTTLSATGVATFSAGTAALPAITTTGDTNTGIFFPAADTIAFSEGGVEAARFDSAGNLGLGVTPSAWSAIVPAFQVGGAFLAAQGTIAYSAQGTNAFYNGSNWIYRTSATASLYQQSGGVHSWQYAASGTAGNAITFTQAMTLDASGNLGVGVTSPTCRLDLNRGSAGLLANFTDGVNANFQIGTSSYLATIGPSADTTAMAFKTSNTEAARIDSSGNLLVGATSVPSPVGNYKSFVVGGTTGGIVDMGTTSTSYGRVSADSVGLNLESLGATTTIFRTNGSERARIDSSGNFGLRVTPNASWDSTFPALQIGLGTVLYNNTSGNGTFLGSNFYWNGSNNIYLNSDFASAYGQSSGQHKFFIAPSGTAGNAISFTQAMTLDSSGNLLVGTTSDVTSGGMKIFPNYDATGSTSFEIGHITGSSSGNRYAGFKYAGTLIGTITQNGTTGVLYNLTSDYRLKNDQQALTGAKDFIMSLKPKKWQWWDGSGEGVGFVAHEFMEVAKYSGNGEKDAIDADGKPAYQAIQPSSSEVMANLVSFIQEQQALITQLTARITALEGA